jgi:membrane associated rhomboid family serine protease
MFLPIHDENPRRTAPVVTVILIGLCVIAWIGGEGAGAALPLARAVCEHGMIPAELSGAGRGDAIALGHGLVCVLDGRPAWHTVLSSMFLHGDWLHLLGNLWFLWLFGDNVEEDLGHARFALAYLACGVVAAFTQYAIDPLSPVPMIGASGAISGVMGAYLVRFPGVLVRVLTVLPFWITIVRVPAAIVLGFWFLLQLLGGLPQVAGAAGGVAFWAHVGGFVAGVLLAYASGAHLRRGSTFLDPEG